MKTSELIGCALDLAVHTALGGEAIHPGCTAPPYSSNWWFGGPIIERELIDLHSSSGGEWTAEKWEYEVTSGGGTNTHIAYGSTLLVAAMRCFVTSRLGDEVKV